MPRRRTVKARSIPPDPVYNSELVAKFINKLMKCGKKSLAERIFYKSMNLIEHRTKKPPLEVFKRAIENTRPLLAVKSRRVGGATYQIPVDVPEPKGISMCMKWLIDHSREKKGKEMAARLADELIDASNKTGATIKKRENTHKMAEANRAFAHYRW
jgi:small subunit ribosomal protein S7